MLSGRAQQAYRNFSTTSDHSKDAQTRPSSAAEEKSGARTQPRSPTEAQRPGLARPLPAVRAASRPRAQAPAPRLRTARAAPAPAAPGLLRSPPAASEPPGPRPHAPWRPPELPGATLRPRRGGGGGDGGRGSRGAAPPGTAPGREAGPSPRGLPPPAGLTPPPARPEAAPRGRARPRHGPGPRPELGAGRGAPQGPALPCGFSSAPLCARGARRGAGRGRPRGLLSAGEGRRRSAEVAARGEERGRGGDEGGRGGGPQKAAVERGARRGLALLSGAAALRSLLPHSAALSAAALCAALCCAAPPLRAAPFRVSLRRALPAAAPPPAWSEAGGARERTPRGEGRSRAGGAEPRGPRAGGRRGDYLPCGARTELSRRGRGRARRDTTVPPRVTQRSREKQTLRMTQNTSRDAKVSRVVAAGRSPGRVAAVRGGSAGVRGCSAPICTVPGPAQRTGPHAGVDGCRAARRPGV